MSTTATLVETRYGTIEGERRGAHTAFCGIPYARPPLGELRFRAPEPPQPWSGVRSARAFGPSALQGQMFAPGVVAEGAQSEDCLYLNVYTPAVDRQRRPVMVWIHGGAFTVGSASSPLYDGRRLAEEHGVVVVTLNYRLGVLGYLPFGDQGERWGAVDNRGQHDQLAALRWVQEHVERFGGDPDNVTLFGESAGGTAVGLLLATPSARGLFRRAIAQSSTGPLRLASADSATACRAALLRALELPEAEPERLAEVPAEALQRAQGKIEEDGSGWPYFNPVVDRVLLPAQPAELLASGQGSDVPLIAGSNRDEWNLFALASLVDWQKPLEDDEAIARIQRKLPVSAAGAARMLLEVYRGSRRARGLPHGNRALLRALEGDLRFRIPTLRLAEHQVLRQPATFVYLFSYESPAIEGLLGACHGLELPFVFGTYDAPNQDRFVGQGEVVSALSRTLRQAWTSFARDGVPRADGLDWPRYELTRRPSVEFGAEVRVVDDPLGEERRAWEGLI